MGSLHQTVTITARVTCLCFVIRICIPTTGTQLVNLLCIILERVNLTRLCYRLRRQPEGSLWMPQDPENDRTQFLWRIGVVSMRESLINLTTTPSPMLQMTSQGNQFNLSQG